MCTAATYQTKDFYMGRTLDYEFSYGEEVTITPRNYEFDFRYAGKAKTHYALIGMAFVAGDYPLYYDAANEKGLGMAGLNFVGNAHMQMKRQRQIRILSRWRNMNLFHGSLPSVLRWLKQGGCFPIWSLWEHPSVNSFQRHSFTG